MHVSRLMRNARALLSTVLLAAAVGCAGSKEGDPATKSGAPPVTAPATAAAAPQTRPADQFGWPRQFADAGGNQYAIYQPQVDKWDGDRLEARAAVEVKRPNSKDADYGIISITAETDVDKEDRLVELDEFQITKADFPQARGAEPAYLAAIRQRVPTAARQVPLDHLEANV